MSGSIDDCNLDAAKTRQSSNQTSLYDYGGKSSEVFIGIVHSANEEMERVCDEVDDRLAPNQDLFSDWINQRDELRDDGLFYTKAHNQAFDSVNYRKRFRNSLSQQVVEEYAERVALGENIVLVCYCSDGCYCHRHIAKQLIHDELYE